MLNVENLSFRYSRHGDPVLQGVNLSLCEGEIGILLGKNGSGKTTLFKSIPVSYTHLDVYKRQYGNTACAMLPPPS